MIGFPEETVLITDGVVSIYDETNEKSFVLDEPYVIFKKNENFSIKLERDEYFVMGDNRAGSSDSRIWGPLPKKFIIGKPIIRLLPLNKIDKWPGLSE